MYLLDLPDDWLFMIVGFCPEKIWTLRRVCRRFHDLISARLSLIKHEKHANLWKFKYKKIVTFTNEKIRGKEFVIWQDDFNIADLPWIYPNNYYSDYSNTHLMDNCYMGLLDVGSASDVIFPVYCFKHDEKAYYKFDREKRYSPTSDEIREHFSPEKWEMIYKLMITDNKWDEIRSVFDKLPGS